MKTWTKILHECLPLKVSPVIDRTLKSAYDLAVCGINYQEYPENFEYMNGYDLTFLSVVAVISGDADFIRALTEYQGRKHLMSYILNILIPCANDREEYEIQIMLLDYKYRIGIFRKKKFDL